MRRLTGGNYSQQHQQLTTNDADGRGNEQTDVHRHNGNEFDLLPCVEPPDNEHLVTFTDVESRDCDVTDVCPQRVTSSITTVRQLDDYRLR